MDDASAGASEWRPQAVSNGFEQHGRRSCMVQTVGDSAREKDASQPSHNPWCRVGGNGVVRDKKKADGNK